MRHRGTVSIRLRSNRSDGIYLGDVGEKGDSDISFLKGTARDHLALAIVPSEAASPIMDTVFAAQGVDLTLWVNGKILATATDILGTKNPHNSAK